MQGMYETPFPDQRQYTTTSSHQLYGEAEEKEARCVHQSEGINADEKQMEGRTRIGRQQDEDDK